MKYIFIVYLLVFVSCVGKRNNFIGSTKTFPLVVRDTLNVKCEDLGNPCLILPYKNFSCIGFILCNGVCGLHNL